MDYTRDDCVAIAGEEGGPRYYGDIMNTPEALAKLIKKVAGRKSRQPSVTRLVRVVWVYRQITGLGIGVM